ncbi:MAG: phosphoenolpyruvate synthase [Patescibacteria group bacterium]|nr:phosphoenolpyruvate synthase [Patescibacteria group bacterium]
MSNDAQSIREEGRNIVWLEDVGMDDVAMVGGKNASLGEMISELAPKGVSIPGGFVVTASAYRVFMESTGCAAFVDETLKGLDTHDLKGLERRGRLIREKIRSAVMPEELAGEIRSAYAQMEERYGKNTDVAVRSSATAEDLPGASFAGEHETYLGIRGANDVLTAVQWAFASLFTDRAISYRTDKGFAETKVALSVGVQKMVRSDKGASGVMFTVDTESGFSDSIIINATYGLGEMIVQGRVTPDEYLVFKKTLPSASQPIVDRKLGDKRKKMIYAKGGKGIARTKIVSVPEKDVRRFTLTDEEVLTLARWALLIEEHYSARAKSWTPMDMEWAKDGDSGELFIVQARPETVQAERDRSKLREYVLGDHGGEVLRGISVGFSIASGKTRVIINPKDIGKFKKGEILVTTMTDPDWEPIMKIASAIVTDEGGRTSHAAIVSRELGIPAIVGSGNATSILKRSREVTVDATGSEGIVYEGKAKVSIREQDIAALPETRTHLMVNIATPDIAFERSFLPVSGVGLAREEFIIAARIGVHPLAALNFKNEPKGVREQIVKKMAGWDDPVRYYVDNLAGGIAKIAMAFHPRPVIVRFSDFKTNEYVTLTGGKAYEPKEENPMLGWRGASRYYDPKFEKAFALECEAIHIVREKMQLENVIPMVPFCRTLEEAHKVLALMSKYGLIAKSLAKEGQKSVPVYMMCEIPSNVILADKFLDLFDGMSIGSNDLTQLALGLDRDSGVVSHVGNENDAAVRDMIARVIKACRARGKYLGICGQGPSDLPDFAEFLVREGIESISLNPDTVIPTLMQIAKIEATLQRSS